MPLFTKEKFPRSEIGGYTKLECNDGTILVHKGLLTASSPYFKEILSASDFGNVVFDWCSKGAMEIVVQYLYTAKFPNLKKDYSLLQELIEICNTLKLVEFRNFCWDFMVNNVTVQRFFDQWAFAVNLDLIGKKSILEKFAENKFESIAQNNGILNLNMYQMEKLILCIDQTKHCESMVKCILKWQGKDKLYDGMKLLSKINLKFLSNATLYNLLQGKQNAGSRGRGLVEEALTDEAISRLSTSCEKCKAINKIVTNIVGTKCNRPARTLEYYSQCRAENALSKLKGECTKLYEK